jgi:hypothetical protein
MKSTDSAPPAPQPAGRRRKPMVLLTTRVEPEVRDGLVAMAKEQGLTLTDLVRPAYQQILNGRKSPAPAPDARNFVGVLAAATSAMARLYTQVYGAMPPRPGRRQRKFAAEALNLAEALIEALAVLDRINTIVYGAFGVFGAPRPSKRAKRQNEDG